jgi:tRNA(Arg) A34 adenosine deaminase TadA
MSEAESMWLALEPPWRAAFEEAWASWRTGCFGIGCVIADSEGRVAARGRNRVLEPADQAGVLGGALIAHAEMNALAVLSLDLRTGENLHLYTTMEPCLMCASALVMVRIGVVHFAAADPMFDGVDEMLRGHPYCAGRVPRRDGPLGGPLESFAGLLPLVFNVTWTPEGRWSTMQGTLFPEHHAFAAELASSGRLRALAAHDATVSDALIDLWPELVSLAG